MLRAELERLRAEMAALRGSGGSSDQLPSSAVVIASEQLGPEQGFYPVERTEDGVAFSWTGPAPQFSFDVAVDRFAGAEMRLEAVSFLDYERQKGLHMTVDGQAVPTIVTKGGMGVLITAALPARTGNEITKLVFALPATLPPANPADTRQLGLAFFRLTVTART